MEIGVIGLGDVGKFCAKAFAKQGYNVCGCDLPEKRYTIERDMDGSGVAILDDGNHVTRQSDLTLYAVPADKIGDAVAQYGPSARKGSIVTGQTSVKTPEVAAFDRYLPYGVHAIPTHFLFRPTEALLADKEKMRRKKTALITDMSSGPPYRQVADIFAGFGTEIVELGYEAHDEIMGENQAATHLGYESMGTAWMNAGTYPWESPHYTLGIDGNKISVCLRVFSGKPHVFGNLAMLNPFAARHIAQFERSVYDLFNMARTDKDGFRKRAELNRDYILGLAGPDPILSDEAVKGNGLSNHSIPGKPNTHLNPISGVDAWRTLGVNPYNNMAYGTAPSIIRLGIAEYVFRDDDLFQESVETSLQDNGIRKDDEAFCNAVPQWTSAINCKDMGKYERLFADVQQFFGQDKLREGFLESERLIESLGL